MLKTLRYWLLSALLTCCALPSQAAITNILVGFIYQSGVPVGIPSSGTFGTNGAVSGLTAFPATYSAIYLFFPANAICAGSAAGLYYTQMSSATAGTVFTNTLATGSRPVIIASPTATVCAVAPGAYTQSLAAQTLITLTLTGGYLGISGGFESDAIWSYNNSANTKTISIALAGSAIDSETATTTASTRSISWVWNRGVQNAQILYPPTVNNFGSTATANTFLAIDTSANQNLTATGTLAAATDFIVIESWRLTGYPQYN